MTDHGLPPVALLTTLMCVGVLTAGCKSRPEAPKPVNPRFVELYSLASVTDAEHTVPITDSRGNSWYRAARPVLDLSHLQLGETYTDECQDGTHTVVFDVKSAHWGRLAVWTEERIGKRIGWVVEGRLIYVAEVKVSMSCRIGIDGFATLEEAERLVRAVDRGGIRDSEP